MKTVAIYKNYLIISISRAPKLGDYEARYFSIRNDKTRNEFKYLVKISGTLEAVKNINSDKKFIAHALPYIKDLLDKKVEKLQEILITTYSEEERKAKGIFYTPVNVVEFIYDILRIWKSKQKARWQGKNPSVIDPAAGEGGFLKIAIDKGFTKPDWVFGIDIDVNAVKKWKEVNLLKEFGGSEDDLEAHFFHQNGLEKVKWDQHKSKYYGRLKKVDIKNEQFDCVVGNPPYGGVGLGETELTDDLIAKLAQYEILPKQVKLNLGIANSQTDLFGSAKSFSLKPEAKQKIKSFPIEILFLDRFIQLTKPGGWIAIIIPDGILTNSNSHYVREFISNRTKVEAIVSLPRETFKNVGTSAKTSILFLRKLKEKETPENSYPVFLASAEKTEKGIFEKIVNSYEKHYNLGGKHMDKSNLVQITKDQKGREVVMVRVDKTLKELMTEKPSSRWDVNYWHPKYEKLLQKLNSIGLKIVTGDDVMLSMTNGNRDREWANPGDEKIRFIQVVNVLNTGVDYDAGDSRKHYARKNGLGDPSRSRLKGEDILLISGATGSIGRACILYELKEPTNVSQDINIIRLKQNSEINKEYLVVYLLSVFGGGQLERYSKGVSGQIKVTFDHIKSIKIPVLKEKVQKSLKEEYRKLGQVHINAMNAKKKGDQKEYKENLETAEKILKDLIRRTEEVIEGKREDVN